MRPIDTRWNLWFAVWVFAGCATTGSSDGATISPANTVGTPGAGGARAAATSPAQPEVALEKVREELQFAPWEVALSGVRGETGPTEMVRARNLVNRPVTISGVKVVGDAANLFSVKGAPVFPVVIPAGGSLAVEVELGPPANATAGLQRGALRFQTGDDSNEGPSADLAALVLSGREVAAEPSLQQVVEALGFAIDVGAKTLQLPEAPEARGDQVVGAALFQRSRATPVALNPVARFSAAGDVSYGYYLPGQSLRNVDTRQLGVMVAGQEGTLNPAVADGAETNFDPGDATFGVWVSTPAVTAGGVAQRAFSEPRRNRGSQRSLARIYPLRARGGAPVPDTYVIAFGEAGRADYQDAVFLISNVKLVGR
jgi:hypothetical protein